MKLLVYLAVWKRPEITEICFMGINRLRNAGLFSIQAFAVISEESMIPLCEKYNIDYVMHENKPLGKKKNFGLQAALKHDFDYMIETGSDDLIKTDILTLYPWGEKHIFGLYDAAMINTATGSCKRLPGNAGMFGAGRAISREAILSGPIWTDGQNVGLDKISNFKLAERGFMQKRFKCDKPLITALKSETNIWSYKSVPGNKYSFEEAIDGLSVEEITAIKCLITQNKSENLIAE